MIKENHEYLADRQVLSAGVNPARYRAQLMNHTLGVNVFRLGNQFNHSLTLKRFKMMKKPNRSLLGIIKIVLLIPAVLLTLGLTTGMTPQQKTIKGKVVFADTGEPAYGASVVIRSTTTGTVADKDGTFMLNVDGDPELVISFVGYGTLIVKASKIGKKPLKLEIEAVTLDLGSVPEVTKGSAGAIALRHKDGSEAHPVFLLDGEVIEGIDNLDPETIESISVYKDPDNPLVKKYNAKDGLISITSKDGKGASVHESGKTMKEMEVTDSGQDDKEAHPVFVVDGKVVNDLDHLDPNLIENLQVIKDLNDHPLVKKYNAKDGLILVTTKDGKGVVAYEFAKNWNGTDVSSNEKNDDEFFFVVEDMPTFNGGDPAPEFRKYIAQNLKYPESAAEKGIGGRVIVQFAVDKRGKVVDAVLVLSVDPALDKEAIRVVMSSPDWTPGRQRGKAVKVLFTFPINFVPDMVSDNKEDNAMQESIEKNEEIFYIVEDMPQFPGGIPAMKTYIYSNLEYPAEAKKQGIEGEVIVQFMINTEGKPEYVKVVQSPYEGFDEPAMKVIREMPDWKPGMQRGKAVRVLFAVPIQFIPPKE